MAFAVSSSEQVSSLRSLTHGDWTLTLFLTECMQHVQPKWTRRAPRAIPAVPATPLPVWEEHVPKLIISPTRRWPSTA
jgi:hypothetical protein